MSSHGWRMGAKGWALALAVWCVAGVARAEFRTVPDLDGGFVVTRDTDTTGNERWQGVGPFWEWQGGSNGMRFDAWRPLFSRIDEPAKDRALSEYLWPVGMVKKYQGQTFWRWLCFYGQDFDNTQTNSRYRTVLFPFVFWGRDARDERYFAVFPLGGKLNEFLGRDRVRFVLFPIYAFSSVNELKTHDVLWPLISTTRGPGTERFRVFPFYGRSESRNGWIRKFVFWPFWTSAQRKGAEASAGGFVLFPLWGHSWARDYRSWQVVPPLFRVENHGGDRTVNCPWPFVQWSSGRKDKLYLWPLWGRKVEKGRSSSFLVWPIGSWRRQEHPDEVIRSGMAVPLFFYESRTRRVAETATPTHDAAERSTNVSPRAASMDADKKASPDVRLRYVKFWPLASYLRDEENVRFRVLDVWFARNTPAVERNLSPLWTLYSHVRNGRCAEDELLWGLYRNRRNGEGAREVSVFPFFTARRNCEGADTREWSLLKGLIGYKRGCQGASYRLLYFLKFGHDRDQPATPGKVIAVHP